MRSFQSCYCPFKIFTYKSKYSTCIGMSRSIIIKVMYHILCQRKERGTTIIDCHIIIRRYPCPKAM